jgi:hypothetical protein
MHCGYHTGTVMLPDLSERGHRMGEGLQVIGVGMHRTGSMSVKAALERLGFGPCYHGLEALRGGTDGDHWLAAYEAERTRRPASANRPW